jgi:signal peptidase I
MAPTLLGNHKETVCPRCGYPVTLGLHEHGKQHSHETTSCPNCGYSGIDLSGRPALAGDHVLVNKNVFDWRRPRRWELVVFRCPADRSRAFVKRVVGLPGESAEVRDGDIYIDHELARKTLAEFKALRIPVFDYDYPPRPNGWQARWEVRGGGESGVYDDHLALDTAGAADSYGWLTYRNCPLDGHKAGPLDDEYSYNGAESGEKPDLVHDFQMECDLEVLRGDGWLALGITDGHDSLQAELPVGAVKGGALLGTVVARSPDGATAADRRPPAASAPGDLRSGPWHGQETGPQPEVYRTAPSFALAAGKTYHVELAFVDRRVTLTVDGVCPFPPVDRPAAAERGGVVSPVRIGARGVDVRVRNFCLFRDIHYTQAGRHAVRAAVRLGAGEYFVLGDNSPNSDDNRFWSDAEGRPLPVVEADLLGKPFLVHMPSRLVRGEAFGRSWQYQGLDWGRVRWLR